MANYLRPAACVAALLAVSCSAPTPAPAPRVEGTSRNGLHYIIEGSGPPVVLVHAFQMDAREWDEIVPELAQDWRVIRYDVRGHGRSAGATKPTAAHEDLRDLLDGLHVSRASLVGLSMGSGIVLDAALAYPDRVDRVVMVSPTVSGVTTIVPYDWMTPIIAQVRAGATDSAAALWWASSMMAGARKRGAAGERYHQVVLDNARIWGENPANRLPLDPPAGQRLESLKAPLLVIAGERDGRHSSTRRNAHPTCSKRGSAHDGGGWSHDQRRTPRRARGGDRRLPFTPVTSDQRGQSRLVFQTTLTPLICGYVWNPTGHEPANIYTLPHLDFHFYKIEVAERNAILPTDPAFAAKTANVPTPEFMPAFAFSPPPLTAVPQMGVHWVDVRSPELQPPPNNQTFTTTFINGTYNGAVIFQEPMITRDFILSKPNATIPIPVAARITPAGYYPAAYSITFDEQAKEHRIALTQLGWRN